MSTRALRMTRVVAHRRRRVAATRQRGLRTAGLGLLAATALVVATWWALTGPLVAIRSLEINGYHRADAAALAQYAQVAAASGTVLNPPEAQVRRALDQFPWVHDFVVRRRWPSGIAIDIVEARPVAKVISAADGQAALISRDGRVLGLATPSPDVANLPHVTVAELPTRVGDRLASAEERAAADILTGLPEDASYRLSDLRVIDGGIFGRLSSGLEVRFGPAERVPQKLTALSLVLPKLRADEVSASRYLDIRAPEAPAAGAIQPSSGALDTTGVGAPTASNHQATLDASVPEG